MKFPIFLLYRLFTGVITSSRKENGYFVLTNLLFFISVIWLTYIMCTDTTYDTSILSPTQICTVYISLYLLNTIFEYRKYPYAFRILPITKLKIVTVSYLVLDDTTYHEQEHKMDWLMELLMCINTISIAPAVDGRYLLIFTMSLPEPINKSYANKFVSIIQQFEMAIAIRSDIHKDMFRFTLTTGDDISPVNAIHTKNNKYSDTLSCEGMITPIDKELVSQLGDDITTITMCMHVVENNELQQRIKRIDMIEDNSKKEYHK